MLFCLKKALLDIRSNRFLTIVTTITISLSILIVAAFYLFVFNADHLIGEWKKGIRMMVYLQSTSDKAMRLNIKYRIQQFSEVKEARFISKKEGLNWLREQMRGTQSLFVHLGANPLPDAFEIHLAPFDYPWKTIEKLALQIEAIEGVAEVESGQRWLGKMSNMLELFKLGGYVLGGIFFMAAVFIVANTIRLVIYTRRDEVEIMRLVGAEDRFIKAPFYLEGLLQGAVGGFVGLAVLYGLYFMITLRMDSATTGFLLKIRFLPLSSLLAIMIGSTLVGGLGSFLSLQQFLNPRTP